MSYFQTFPSEVIMPTTPVSYPSDLSEAQWKLVAPLIPVPQSSGRPREYGLREIVNAIFYVLRSGCSWRMLPHDFPPWGTVYHYFRRWSKDGVFEQMNAQLRADLRERLGRSREASASIMDSQSVKITDWKVQTIQRPRKWIRVREGEESPPRPLEPAGFKILPKCWVVERSFA